MEYILSLRNVDSLPDGTIICRLSIEYSLETDCLNPRFGCRKTCVLLTETSHTIHPAHTRVRDAIQKSFGQNVLHDELASLGRLEISRQLTPSRMCIES